MRISEHPHAPSWVNQTNTPQSDRPGFGALLEESLTGSGPDSGRERLREAARQMEIHLVTSLLKTMDAAGGEGGLLGNRSEGMGYFKSQFFHAMAAEIVEQQSLGFAESLENTYAPRPREPLSVKIGDPLADEMGEKLEEDGMRQGVSDESQ